ncbi:hypothetical protein GWN42_13580 [candidate division KSB1 bacterium]|nr:hypothetical protein [candidate division KSB1 bacterium]
MGFAQLGNLLVDPVALARFFGFVPVIVGDIIVDVLVSETPVYDYDVTEHPVEAGLDVTDNRVARPATLILDCILTDIALSPQAIAGAVAAGVLAGGFPPLTWQAKYDALLGLAAKNDIVDVFTPLNTYSSMMITSVRPNQNKDTSQALFFNIEMREIRTVASEINIVDPSQIPKKIKEQEKPENTEAGKKTAPKKKKGPQGTEETGEKNSSTLNDLFGSVFG